LWIGLLTKVGAETYSSDLNNQNHCEKLKYSRLQHWQRYFLQNWLSRCNV